MASVSNRLRKYGLRYDDLYDPMYDLDMKEALNRLPREIVDARNQRLKRAMDLSMKHDSLQTLICGVLGLPPSNGVLPQAYKESCGSKSPAMFEIGEKKAKECMKIKASKSELYGRMQTSKE